MIVNKYTIKPGANLQEADLQRAHLQNADLREADLWKANLREANLWKADLREANLRRAHLQNADLREANLQEADLREADLQEADLQRAHLQNADLREADLRGADLRGAYLSNSIGLLNPIDYLKENFEQTSKGIIVYKIFNNYKPLNPNWKIEKGSIITEVCDPSRTIDCGCGINVATLEWCKSPNNQNNKNPKIWKCLIRWKWAASIVVPYNTNGKIRCERLELLEII